jgi:predicted CXXCH cytochrome family protein
LLVLGLCAAVVFPAIAGPRAGHDSFGCGQCHVAHVSDQPGSVGSGLWNAQNAADSLAVFKLYGSPRFDSLRTDIGQPDGPSLLCLGCHDGSYAGFPASANSAATFAPDDLARSHPISFTYDRSLAARVPDGRLRDPSATPSGLGGTIADDLLDENDKVQCTSCHDVHSTSRGPKLLRYGYEPGTPGASAMCRVCHDK